MPLNCTDVSLELLAFPDVPGLEWSIYSCRHLIYCSYSQLATYLYCCLDVNQMPRGTSKILPCGNLLDYVGEVILKYASKEV